MTEGEDEFAILRLIRSGDNLSRATVVTVNPVPGTADGASCVFSGSFYFLFLSFITPAPQDFTSDPITVTFTAGQTETTVSVPITDDFVVEDTEVFSAMLSSGDENVMFVENVANVTILDNDGKVLPTY